MQTCVCDPFFRTLVYLLALQYAKKIFLKEESPAPKTQAVVQLLSPMLFALVYNKGVIVILEIVLYLQYLGLLEPSAGKGNHLLIISLWSRVTLTVGRTSPAVEKQQCLLSSLGCCTDLAACG